MQIVCGENCYLVKLYGARYPCAGRNDRSPQMSRLTPIRFDATDLDAIATTEGRVAIMVTPDGKLDPGGPPGQSPDQGRGGPAGRKRAVFQG